MPLENGKWRVISGDCLWNIALSVYSNAYKWTSIADANGISRRTALIYPGQLLTLPGITSGSVAASPPAPAPPPVITKCSIVWFSLLAGSEREMMVFWSYNGKIAGNGYFLVRWEIWDDNNGQFVFEAESIVKGSDYRYQASHTFTDRPGLNRAHVSIRPTNENGDWLPNTAWVGQEYDFRNNPPKLPPDPTVDIDANNVLSVTFSNIDENINGDTIEVAVYQDNDIKYITGKVPINKETLYAKYKCNVEPGHTYIVRARAIRGNIYGGWTNFSEELFTVPNPPTEITTLRAQTISEQMSTKYGVFVEWDEVKEATTYEVQYTTNPDFFDTTSGVTSVNTEEGKGPRILISDIEVGHEYFFRVRSTNSKGSSLTFTPIKSVKIGSKPSAPTTWSNTTSAVMGEDLKLYWTHNSTDGSIESYARLHLTIIDSLNPDLQPMEYDKVIKNEKPEEDKDKNSVYVINTNDPEWSMIEQGFIIKWKVQTAGVGSEYSNWSVEREINVYTNPELELDILNSNSESINEISIFPFFISVLAKPSTQVPISYYIEIIANQSYVTVDKLGNQKTINVGDKVYQRYYDPQQNPWRFLIEMTPYNIDLESGIEYTINCTVSMNSGLTAINTVNFTTFFTDNYYTVGADIILNKDNYEASIHPYCLENVEDSEEQKLVENCTLSVYRIEYDGSYTEIATNINNEPELYITDPHPSLDYARYRIIARTNDTGALSFADTEPIKFGITSVIIQWDEPWENFDSENEDTRVEQPWSGSLLELPYNLTLTENTEKDVSLVSYIGRKNPVSYYGTQINDSFSLTADIPRYDKETVYGLRRLNKWNGDVYIREPSGIGYWANITCNFTKSYDNPVIPITLDVKRVEGGM